MTFEPLPERLNVTDWFLDARLREGRGGRRALSTASGEFTYAEVAARTNRWGRALAKLGVEEEQRVMIALPDDVDFVAAFFGTLKIGAAVVMVNPELKPEAIAALFEYTRAKVVLHDVRAEATFAEAVKLAEAAWGHRLKARVVTGGTRDGIHTHDAAALLSAEAADLECFPTHRDDAAIWLFSGGTTGSPKAVLQTHRSFANTTRLYAQGVLGYKENDVTLSVPKLFFGYATGANLLFPFSVGATAVLFHEKCTADVLFEKIRVHRPTVLINVPTMINQMVSHPDAARQDLSSIRITTSAGEALPPELDARWRKTFGVELLDGLGTAEMWHIFLTNEPGRARPGSLGRVVPGFEVRVCDESGREVPRGEVGALWVRGGSRAICYWHEMEKTEAAFRGEWYASSDMVRQDEDGIFWYCGRGDDMLKVSGKWLSPAEVENCLLQHPRVAEAAVVGVVDANGLTKPHAFVVARGGGEEASESAAPGRTDGPGSGAAARAANGGDAAAFAEELRAFTLGRLDPYKCPRQITVMDAFPRTHLGKVDRGKLRGV